MHRIKALLEKDRNLKKYFNDPKLRVRLSLIGSVSINIFYAVIQLISGIYFHELWFYALAAYYILLIVMRVFLLRHTAKVAVPGENRLKEFHRYRFCGIMMLLMNQALAIIVFYVVKQNRGLEYHYIHTIGMAAYTFTAMVVAMINVVRYRRYESPLMSAAKAISLVSAVVSLFTLESAIISAFDQNDSWSFRQITTASTGGAVCIFVLSVAVYMIFHSSREIKRLGKKNKNNLGV